MAENTQLLRDIETLKNIKTVTLHVSNYGKIKVRFLSIFESSAITINENY